MTRQQVEEMLPICKAFVDQDPRNWEKTKKHVAAMLPIYKAFVDGEQIQVMYNVSDTWADITDLLPTDHVQNYRIKPKETLVPYDFSDAERCIGRPVRHKATKRVRIIKEISENQMLVGNRCWVSLEQLFIEYEFLDGTPCGKPNDEIKTAASTMGKKGGKSKSDAKKKAARDNKLKALADGKNKGGRPRKQPIEPKTDA